MIFYLGTHMPHWLNDTDVPLFVSHRRLIRNKKLPRASHRWALDSGGFTELSMFGGWQTPPAQYHQAVQTYADRVGNLDWAAPQDWMCEPFMLAKTGLTILEHQRRTVMSLVHLRLRGGSTPFIPVLQGWELPDYQRHIEMYGEAGIDLRAEPTVGLGSVCRRQYTSQIGEIVQALSYLPLHGFGVKNLGLRRYGTFLHSADSMAWSYNGRYIRPCPHTGSVSCANCKPHALAWRDKALHA